MNKSSRLLWFCIGFVAALLLYSTAIFGIGFSRGFFGLKPDVERVAVLGDDLTAASLTDVEGGLRTAGWQKDVRGYPGLTLNPAHAPADAVKTPPLARMLQEKPDVFVLALGTNDAKFLQSSAEQSYVSADLKYQTAELDALTKSAADTAKQLADVRCVIVVSVQEDTEAMQLTRWGRPINDALHQHFRQDDYMKPFFVRFWLDWGATLAEHPDYRSPDGVGMSEQGNKAYAAAITDAIKTKC